MTEATKVAFDDLLRVIRDQFYTDQPAKRFYQDRHFLSKSLTWPATWLRRRGLSWAQDRYFTTLSQILIEIRQHGLTAQVQYFPGYLLKCLQDHFAHNSDRYCDEGRTARNAIEQALSKVDFAQSSQLREQEQFIDVMAAAHSLLATPRKARKTPKIEASQPSLFDVSNPL